MKRINYGNVAATLALVFAMSGGAVAATGVVSSNAHPGEALRHHEHHSDQPARPA